MVSHLSVLVIQNFKRNRIFWSGTLVYKDSRIQEPMEIGSKQEVVESCLQHHENKAESRESFASNSNGRKIRRNKSQRLRQCNGSGVDLLLFHMGQKTQLLIVEPIS